MQVPVQACIDVASSSLRCRVLLPVPQGYAEFNDIALPHSHNGPGHTKTRGMGGTGWIWLGCYQPEVSRRSMSLESLRYEAGVFTFGYHQRELLTSILLGHVTDTQR